MAFTIRTTALAVSAAALLCGAAAFAASPVPLPPARPGDAAAMATTVSSRHHLKDGSYRGPAVRHYYGYVQVRANIRHGRIASIDILRYPHDRSTSRWINRRALPALETEVIRAQSLRVSGVSGATLTSEAFLMSMQGALQRAGG
ncbi:FMN-binding protein [Acidimangrovimonas pyrenivorans]|uniref:FMN-binding protein n=1 Tax=Acidimangrovimonas pyrenivorans TaxID=2030798 RepID=A0ABV7ABQ2_9RHOB